MHCEMIAHREYFHLIGRHLHLEISNIPLINLLGGVSWNLLKFPLEVIFINYRGDQKEFWEFLIHGRMLCEESNHNLLYFIGRDREDNVFKLESVGL